MGVSGGHHTQGTAPADPTGGVHAAGCGLAPLPSWPPAPCTALRLLETSPPGDPSPEGAPGWHRGGSADISTQLDCRAGFPRCRTAPGTSNSSPYVLAPSWAASCSHHPAPQDATAASAPASLPTGTRRRARGGGERSLCSLPPPLRAPKSGCGAAHPPRPAPPRTHSSCTSSSRRRGSHPTSPRAECRARVPGAAFYTRPSRSRSPVSRGTSLPDWFPTGSLSGSGLGDTGWAGGLGPAPSPSQTGRREADLGTSRLQADSRVPGEPRHLPALSAGSRGSLLPHVHSPRVPWGSAGRWGHGGGLGDNPAFQQPPRPARIPAMPLPRARLPRAPGALRGHRGTDPAQPLSTPPPGSFKRGSCPRQRLCGRGPLGCRDGLGVLDLARHGGGVDLDPSTMGLKANSQLSQHPGAPPACTDTSN